MIRAGDLVVISSVEDGDVDILDVIRVSQEPAERQIAHTSDMREWLADTGEPLARAWRGHTIRKVDESELRPMIGRVLERGRVPEAVLAHALGVLLRGERR